MRTHALVLAIVLSSFACLSSEAAQRLTILHTNDVHGHLRPFSYPEIAARDSRLAELPARRDVGGIARRAALAARIRTDLAGQGTPVWLVDTGDFYFYSPFSIEYHGKADVIAMGRAGYDLGTLGNHEFEDSLPRLRELIAAAHYPILCANVKDRATGRPLTQTHEVRRVGEVRVGVFGLVVGSAAEKPAAQQGLLVEDALTVAPAMVARLRGEERADIVVLISHCGIATDRRLAAAVRGIDVIVGGHSHTRLPQGEVVSWSDGLKPDETDGTVIVQTGQSGVELGRLDLLLEKNAAGRWRVQRHRARLLPVTGETSEDPAVAAVLDSLWAPHAAKYDEVLATAAADFGTRGDDLPQNNFCADAIRAEFGVEVGLEGTGGVHWPIVAGPVTRASFVDLDVRPYTIVTFRMRGDEIRRLVERQQPVGSGLRYRLFCGRLEEIMVGDAPLDTARVYSCAASSAVVGRLGGFGVLEPRDTGRRWADVVIDAARRAGTITPLYDGRRVVIDTLRTGSRSE